MLAVAELTSWNKWQIYYTFAIFLFQSAYASFHPHFCSDVMSHETNLLCVLYIHQIARTWPRTWSLAKAQTQNQHFLYVLWLQKCEWNETCVFLCYKNGPKRYIIVVKWFAKDNRKPNHLIVIHSSDSVFFCPKDKTPTRLNGILCVRGHSLKSLSIVFVCMNVEMILCVPRLGNYNSPVIYL